MCVDLSSGPHRHELMGLRTTLVFARAPHTASSAPVKVQLVENQRCCMIWFPLMLRWVDPLFADGCSHRSRPVPSTCLGASDLLWSLTALLQSNSALRAMRL